MGNLDVSIIFVNYKTKDLTINAIKSVIEKTIGVNYEIFVVDNNSADGSIEEIEKTFSEINIIKNDKNFGFGFANNLAIRKSQGKYVFCLNTDTILVNNAIKLMYDYMEQNSNVGACGAYLLDKYKKPAPCGGNLPSLLQIFLKIGFNKIFKDFYKNFSLTLCSNDKKYLKSNCYVSGAAIFLRKSIFNDIGLFDENLFMFYEDTDLCKRIIDKKFTVKFLDEPTIIHLEGQSTKNPVKRKLMSKKSEFYYFKKYYKSMFLSVKYVYLILYIFNWLLLRDADSKELLKFVYKL